MSGNLQTDQRDATCGGGTNETNAFEFYLGKCRTTADTTRAKNFFIDSLEPIKDTFQKLRAQGDDLIILGDSMKAMTSLSGNSVNGVNERIKDLQKQVKELETTKNNYLQHSKSADKSFLEEVMNGTPQAQTAPSLQDATLLLFWFSWIVMIFTLIAVRWFSPGGSWQAGLFTLFLLALVTACLYSLLIQIA
jgi:hypothetical protein